MIEYQPKLKRNHKIMYDPRMTVKECLYLDMKYEQNKMDGWDDMNSYIQAKESLRYYNEDSPKDIFKQAKFSDIEKLVFESDEFDGIREDVKRWSDAHQMNFIAEVYKNKQKDPCAPNLYVNPADLNQQIENYVDNATQRLNKAYEETKG